MDTEIIVIRLLHIVPGVVWAGGAIFATLIMEPRLSILSPEVRGPAMRSVGKLMGPVFTVLAIITIGSGFALIARTPGREYDQLFDTGWGWAIGIGIIATFIMFAFGLATARTAMIMGRLTDSLQGPPSPEQSSQLQASVRRLRLLARIVVVFAFIAIGSMAAAGWV